MGSELIKRYVPLVEAMGSELIKRYVPWLRPIKRYVPLVEASCCGSSLVMTLKPTGDPFSGSPL